MPLAQCRTRSSPRTLVIVLRVTFEVTYKQPGKLPNWGSVLLSQLWSFNEALSWPVQPMGTCSVHHSRGSTYGRVCQAHRFDRPFGPTHMGGLISVSCCCIRWKHRLTLVGLPNKQFLVKGGETPIVPVSFGLSWQVVQEKKVQTNCTAIGSHVPLRWEQLTYIVGSVNSVSVREEAIYYLAALVQLDLFRPPNCQANGQWDKASAGIWSKACYWLAFSDCGASALLHEFVVHPLLPH